MAYRNKEDCLKEAERLGIDVSSMTWPQIQKAVSEALKLEKYGEVELKPKKMPRKNDDITSRYIGKTVVLAPELSPERYRLIKYDEVLGPDYEVTERHFDLDANDNLIDTGGGSTDYNNVIDQVHDYTTGTFRLKKRADRQVVATSSVPKENAGMYYRPGIDWATVVTWNGRAGYLWKHWRYPNVKQLLIESGYYNQYKHLFKDEPNVWYAAGKMLVCDPYLVDRVFNEIMEDAKEKLRIRKARNKQLGLD